MNDVLEIRPAREADTNFIYSSWLRSYKWGNSFLRGLPDYLYYPHMTQLIDYLIKVRNVKIEVVCLREDSDIIVGYVVKEHRTVHFLFVKEAWRKLGIAKSLVPKDLALVTHFTNVGVKIFTKLYPTHEIFRSKIEPKENPDVRRTE